MRVVANRPGMWCNGVMNLLVRAILGLRQRTTAGLGVGVLIVGSLVAVEILGRRSTTDLHDLLALAALMPLFMLVVAFHKRSPIAGLTMLSRNRAWRRRTAARMPR